jgi:hypothetical protein
MTPNEKKFNDCVATMMRYAAIIGMDKKYLPALESTGEGAYLDIDLSGRLYYVIKERGQELKNESGRDMDEILFQVFKDATFTMACNYEKQNRIAGEDTRRQMFAKWTELLQTLNKKWGDRVEADIKNTLWHYPYDDNASLRASHIINLVKNGVSSIDAKKEDNQKYPLPKRD